MRRFVTTILIVFASAVGIRQAGAMPGVAGDDGTIVIRNISLVSVREGLLIPNQTVTISGRTILRIEPSGSSEPPDNTLIIDGAGKYLIPGLADMHVHFWSKSDLKLFVANGVTTVRNLLKTDLNEWKTEIENGTYPGPTIYTAVMLDGPGGIWEGRGSRTISSPDQADPMVKAIKEEGFHFVKVYDRIELDVFNAIVAAAKKYDIKLVGHVPQAVGISKAIDAPMYCIEHVWGFYRGVVSEDRNSYDASKISELVSRAVAKGTWLCPTLVFYKKYAPVDQYAARAETEGKQYLPMSRRIYWKLNVIPEKERDTLHEVNRTVVKEYYERGGNIIAGTDVGNPFMVPGFSLHEELANLVKLGMTPAEALRCATVNAAKFMGMSGKFGEVIPGARADLVLLDANPLDDINNSRSIQGVMLQGRWYPRDRIDSELLAPEEPLNPVVENFLEALRYGAIARAMQMYERDEGKNLTKDVLDPSMLNVIAFDLAREGRSGEGREVAVFSLGLFPDNERLKRTLKQIEGK